MPEPIVLITSSKTHEGKIEDFKLKGVKNEKSQSVNIA